MKLLILLTVFLLTGCVGTVKDLSIDDTSIVSKFEGNFGGVDYGESVSHTKVQLYFKPATGGNKTFSYVVFLDGNFNNSIAALSSEDVKINSDGYVTMLVPNLPNAGKTYSFTVRAVDLISGEQDSNTKAVTVATLDNIYPDFNGILRVENVSGISGQTQLKVSWNKAKPGAIGGGGFGGNPYDILGYVIYYATTEQNVFNGSTATVNDPNQTKMDITGLLPNTNYFVAVRARDIQTPTMVEQNKIIRSAKTRSSQPISFAGLTSVSIPKSDRGYFEFNATWKHGTGSFDRYKIFYTDGNDPINPMTHPSNKTIEFTDLSAPPSAVISGLESNTKYRVAMAACSDSECNEHAGSDIILEVTTSPPVASFNGITSLSPGEGPSLVDTMKLSWSTPDPTTGAYDGFNIYMMNGDTKTLLPVGGGAFVSNGPSGTGATIKGLVEGSTYCFQAKAYINDPAGLREDSNSAVKCLTLNYQQPVFAGISPSCTNVATNTFKVSWIPATGVFDSYEVYYRVGNSSEFVWSDAIAGNSEYIKIPVNSSQSSLFLPALNPGLTYSIGVKTFFQHPNGITIYRSNSNITASCTTNENRLKSDGWFNIMALGPKVDGLTGNKAYESISDVGEAINGFGTGVITPFPTIVETTEIRPITPPAQGTNASQNGIVHLTWNDFVYETGDRFCGADCTSLKSNDGYYVYRMAYNHTTHSSAVPQRNDVNWVLLNNAKPVKSKMVAGKTLQYQASYTDYAFDNKPSNDATIYWYKVEPIVNGSVAPMVSPSDPSAVFEDYIIKVILPPENMGFVHRWIANLQTCSKYNRQPDRKNQYRCAYNGLGATSYNVNGVPKLFYDLGGHNLVDRYEMSCNFTRATDPKKCPSDTFFLHGECISVGTISISSSLYTAHTVYGSFNNVPTPVDIPASTGAIMYNTRGLTHGGGVPHTFNTRSNYLNSNATNLANDATGKYEITTCNYFNGAKWIPLHDVADKNTTSNQLTSMAHDVTSNKAGMPPLTTITQAQFLSLCQGYNVNLKLSPSSSLIGSKRLPRRTEQIIYSDWNPNINDTTADSLETGNTDLTCITQHGSTLSGHPRGTSTEYVYADLQSTADFFADNRYPGKALNSLLLFKTGSEGNHSSTMCQSRYGLKDTIGNVAEWAIDRATCSVANGCDFGQITLDLKTRSNYFSPTDLEYLKYSITPSLNDIAVPLSVISASDITENYLSNFGAGLLGANMHYINPLLGLPLWCTGTKCGSGSDDNAKISAITNPEAQISNFNIRGDNFIIGGLKYNEDRGIISGGFPVNGIYNNRIGGVQAGVYSGVLAPSMTMNAAVGGRCAIKVNENENGGLQATSSSSLFD